MSGEGRKLIRLFTFCLCKLVVLLHLFCPSKDELLSFAFQQQKARPASQCQLSSTKCYYSQNVLLRARGTLYDDVDKIFREIPDHTVTSCERHLPKRVLGNLVTPRTVLVTPDLPLTIYEAIGMDGAVADDWIDGVDEQEAGASAAAAAAAEGGGEGGGGGGGTDPFGAVLWPAAHLLARTLAALLGGRGDAPPPPPRVLELGAGTGLCSLVAASLGAEAIATDNNMHPLNYLKHGAEEQGLNVTVQHYDFCTVDDASAMALFKSTDLIAVADCIYNEDAAQSMAKQCSLARQVGTKVILLDSVNIARTEFVKSLSDLGVHYNFREVKVELNGSAVLVDEDIHYNSTVGVFLL